MRQYYESVLRDIEKGIKDAARYRIAMGYYVEALGEGCEMLRFVSSFGKAIPHAQRDKGEMRANLLVNVKMYYKDYSEKVDRTVMKALLKIVRDDLNADLLPEFFETLKNEYRGDVDKFVDDLYEHSVFANQERLLAALDNPSLNIKEDVVYKMSEQLEKKRGELFRLVDGKRAVAQRAILEYNKGILNFDQQNYYPNADKTIRLSYGTICDLPLENGDVKPFQTCLSGVIRKAKSDNPDFYLPDKLKKLWESKDFGRYNQNGDVPADFIMNGDVTGGNSGSPLLNAKGELIGLVFDCNWESMTRDFNFDQKLHRVICLDVRYLLFITEKYAHAENVINEILKD